MLDTRSSNIRKWFTPLQVGERYGVSTDKVLAWIHSGQLRGVNVATRVGGRPRWRVSEADLIAFEAGRAAAPAGPATKRRLRQEKAATRYF